MYFWWICYGVFLAWSMMKLMVLETNASTDWKQNNIEPGGNCSWNSRVHSVSTLVTLSFTSIGYDMVVKPNHRCKPNQRCTCHIRICIYTHITLFGCDSPFQHCAGRVGCPKHVGKIESGEVSIGDLVRNNWVIWMFLCMVPIGPPNFGR